MLLRFSVFQQIILKNSIRHLIDLPTLSGEFRKALALINKLIAIKDKFRAIRIKTNREKTVQSPAIAGLCTVLLGSLK